MLYSVNAAAMDCGASVARGEGLTRAKAGVTAGFEIFATDTFGNRCSSGASGQTCATRAAQYELRWPATFSSIQSL